MKNEPPIYLYIIFLLIILVVSYELLEDYSWIFILTESQIENIQRCTAGFISGNALLFVILYLEKTTKYRLLDYLDPITAPILASLLVVISIGAVSALAFSKNPFTVIGVLISFYSFRVFVSSRIEADKKKKASYKIKELEDRIKRLEKHQGLDDKHQNSL